MFLPGEFHGQRGLVGYSLWGCKESNTTKQLTHIHRHTHTHIHLNAEFQGIARRDKKAFLSDQCKVIEENRMGKTRDVFKKIRDIKGTFMQRQAQ